MATVIDRLVVELGLDPAKFTQGQRDTLASFKRTQDEARKGAVAVEGDGKRVADVFGGIKRQALGLGAALLGGMGLKQFAQYITTLDANTGRLAKTLLVTTEELSAWQGVARVTGGDANQMSNSLANLSGQVQHFMLTGQGSFLPVLNVLGIGLFDANKKLKTTTQLFLEISRAVEKMDPARAKALMSSLGIDPQTINTLLRGETALRALLEEQKKIGTATKASSDAAQELETAWGKVQLRAENTGRAFMKSISPVLVWTLNMLDRIGNKIERIANRGQIEGKTKPWGTGVMPVPGAEFVIPETAPAPTPVSPTTSPKRDITSDVLRVKPGAGAASTATSALARQLQESIPGLDRFTSFNDPYHALLGRGSAHTRGQALDFTIKDPTQSAAVATQVRAKLAALGIDAKVLDEYSNPSRGSTGGHLHVQFNNSDAAAKYAGLYGAPAAAAAADINNSKTNTSQSTTNVGQVVIHTAATDAPGISKEITGALKRANLAGQANYGQQ